VTPPIDPGSLPDWIEASTGIAALAVTTRNRIKQRGSDFGNAVKDGTGLSGAAIAEALEEDDLLCELVERGLRSAVASSSESKRRLLAKVVSSAISGDGLATPDEYRILMGTVEELEPPHVQLLVLLSTPPTEHTSFDGTRLEGAYTELEIAQRQPEGNHSDPCLTWDSSQS